MGLRGGLFYTGIKFYDARRSIIANYTWSNNTDAIETPKFQIPDDMNIVGFKCSTESGNFMHLAFLLARNSENFVSQ